MAMMREKIRYPFMLMLMVLMMFSVGMLVSVVVRYKGMPKQYNACYEADHKS